MSAAHRGSDVNGTYAGDPVNDVRDMPVTGRARYGPADEVVLGHPAARAAGLSSRFWNSSARPSWPLVTASSCWACRVSRKATVVWKNPQPSQMVSKAQSSLAGRVHQPLPSI